MGGFAHTHTQTEARIAIAVEQPELLDKRLDLLDLNDLKLEHLWHRE